MEFIYIGKIVNTHGIKGELRLLSKFDKKDKVFKKGFKIYIGEAKEEQEINTYRHHKNFEMITLIGYNNINQVLKYLKEKVYVKREDLELNKGEYLEKDLIGMIALTEGKVIGEVIDIENVGDKNKLLVIKTPKKELLIPYNKNFLVKIDLQKREIELKLIKGMI